MVPTNRPRRRALFASRICPRAEYGGSGRGRRSRARSCGARLGRRSGTVVGAMLAVQSGSYRRRVMPSRGTARKWAFVTSLGGAGGVGKSLRYDNCHLARCEDAPRCVGGGRLKNCGHRGIFGRAAACSVKGLRCPSRFAFPSPPLLAPPSLCFLACAGAGGGKEGAGTWAASGRSLVG